MAQGVKSRKRQSAEQRPNQQDHAAPSRVASARWRGAVLFAVGIAVGAGGLFSVQTLRSRSTPPTSPPVAARAMPTSYYDLLAMSPDELAKVDVALMNLLCAKGLPGAENLDIPAILKQLDEWVAKVKSETERHLYRVKDPRYAEHYANSEARLRAEFVVQVRQDDYGVRYNPERVGTPDFRNSQDLFLYGLVGSTNGGTCSSMPLIYTVIGRRLGYPMKLVLAHSHIFCRWDGENERFHSEGASNGNVNYDPDEYCKTWPKPLNDADIASGVYLTSMTPTQESVVFLEIRGSCCNANRRLPDARAAFAEAHRLEPRSPNTFAGLLAACGVGPTLRRGEGNPAACRTVRSPVGRPATPAARVDKGQARSRQRVR